MADKLTANDLINAIIVANEEKHPAFQAYIAENADLTDVVIDGHINITRIAQLISERQGVGQSL